MEKPYGALITDVEKGESGDDAGLQAGDVIIEFNGKEIKFGSDLPHVVGRIQPKTKANAKVIRDGKNVNLKFVLGELPADERTFIPAKTEISPIPLDSRLKIYPKIILDQMILKMGYWFLELIMDLLLMEN